MKDPESDVLGVEETCGINGREHSIHTDPRRKVFNDPVHGHIELHPPCIEIIDTPQFQRLRYLKQLGCVYFVYPGASHNRFEHSLGTCFLAGQLITALRQRQPELQIDDKDVLCVEIAALCHDLGHGPFSHVFESRVIPEILEEKSGWSHEEVSVKMFDYMLAENGKVRRVFEEKGLTADDVLSIKEMIGNNCETHERQQKKPFLYQIVSNKINGVDVDKWDYFIRDCYMLGVRNNFDHNRLIKFARVIETDKGPQICYRDKDVWNLYDMFHTRYTLHIRAYQHRAVRNVEALLSEALVEANSFLSFTGRNGTKKNMSEAVDDMTAYMKMTDDSIFHNIRNNTFDDKSALKAKKLLDQIQNRELLKFVGQTQLTTEKKWPNTKETRLQIRTEVLAKVTDKERLNDEEVFVDIVVLNYGKGACNPIDRIYFYMKSNPDATFRINKEQVSHMLPYVFEEQYIRLYTRDNNVDAIKALRDAFCKWCKDNTYPVPIGY